MNIRINKHLIKTADDRQTYQILLDEMPKAIDWSKLSEYEQEDNTAGSQTLACSGDSCEIVDLV